MQITFNFKSFFSFQQRFFWISFITFFPLLTYLWNKTTPVLAQVDLPTCQAPLEGEYLLLVNTPTVENQERLSDSIPNTIDKIICNYNSEIVTRLGGLSSLDEADRWGQYVIEIVGLPAVIARPPETIRTPVIEPPPTTSIPNTNPAVPISNIYNPQPLGEGYAVLVNYFNRPEVASELRDFLEKDIGLISYFSRPYLLALHTQNITEANELLTRLSRQDFWTVVVDSQNIMILTPTIQY